jgi:hypothetical protein
VTCFFCNPFSWFLNTWIMYIYKLINIQTNASNVKLKVITKFLKFSILQPSFHSIAYIHNIYVLSYNIFIRRKFSNDWCFNKFHFVPAHIAKEKSFSSPHSTFFPLSSPLAVQQHEEKNSIHYNMFLMFLSHSWLPSNARSKHFTSLLHTHEEEKA